MIINKLSDRNTPRWIIFLIDLLICTGALLLAYQLRFNFRVPETEIRLWKISFTTVILVRALSFFISKIYSGIIRYTSTKDALRVFFTISVGSIIMGLSNFISVKIIGVYLVPFSVLIIEYFASVFSLTAFRILVKTIYQELKNPTRDKKQVIIYGAGEAGLITKRALDRDAETRFRVIAFIDDDPSKAGKTVEGIRIFQTDEMYQLFFANRVENLILSVQNLSTEKKQFIVDKCLSNDINILNVPPVTTWINGELSFKQIKKVKIVDLLERDPIQLDFDVIRKQLTGKTILITGGAGSIGSEIARQIIPFKPKHLVILDQAESALYDLELELNENFRWKNFETVIADIRQYERMERVFNHFKPEVVFHAAAYKHVPVMESNPSEAILTNVQGTKIIADLSLKYNAEKFVMVSTDKAVNPTSLMGATKRIAEIYCQSLNKISTTKFITTRFGNVLDSNGSVIPRFKKQLEEGGPITVTHPDIERFFMTIPEACQLVLEAGAMGNGGEIFIFDMGKSIKIVDLAKKMIKLSGLNLGTDIQIIYTGLRPGEKIYEELLANKETTLPTHHSKIMIAKVREYDFPTIEKEIIELIDLFKLQNNEVIVKKMKSIVPEYVSANSQFQKLDN